MNGKWKYLLCLYDSKLNTLAGRFLVDSETTETVENFLNKTLRNQNKKSITTDLKKEYLSVVSRLGVKHQFCIFHVMKTISKRINEDIRKNNYSKAEIDNILKYKTFIFDMLREYTFEMAEYMKNSLINKNKDLPDIINKILWDFIVPYFKNLTYYLTDSNIESTSNKLENYFHQNFNKSIKKLYKIENGILKQFDLITNKLKIEKLF